MKTSLQRIVAPPEVAPPSPSWASTTFTKALSSEIAEYSNYKSNNNNNNNNASSTGTTATGDHSNSNIHNNNNSMRQMTVHPSLPFVAYWLEAPKPAQRQIIVQTYHRGSGYITKDVLFCMSMADLTSAMYEYDIYATDATKKQDAAIRSLGPIQRINFFDPASLFYSGMTTHQSDIQTPTPTPTTTPSSHKENNATNDEHTNDNNLNVNELAVPRDHRWQALILQFQRKVVVLNLKIGPNSRSMIQERRFRVSSAMQPPSNKTTTPPTASKAIRNNASFSFRPILCQISENKLSKIQPTTTALPITPTIFALGCIDGSIRIYDWNDEKVVKSARGPTSDKNDYIVDLVAANPYGKHDSSNNHESYEDNKLVHRRFVAISKKGAAIVWEIVLKENTIIEIRPPIYRLEGHKWESTTRSAVGDEGGDSSGIHGSSSNDELWMEHRLVEYDPERNVLFWFVPSGYKGSSKAHVLVWDLSAIEEQQNSKKRKEVVAPKLDPFLVVVVPKEICESETMSLTGWLHPSFPSDALTCAFVTANGDLHVLSCPMIIDPGNKSTNVRKETDPIIFFSAGLSDLAQLVTGNSSSKIRVHSLASPRIMDTSILMVNTNLGIFVLRLEDECDVTGNVHMHLGPDMEDAGNSVLLVKHSSVFWSKLDITGPNPVGRVPLQETPSLVYVSPPPSHLPIEVQKRSVRLPPQFLRSPSGTFLCLFWQDELRYEILHLETILQRCSATIGNRTSEVYSPAVDTGVNIFAFAWVGDEDHFALLHSPSQEDFRSTSSSAFDVTPTNASISRTDPSTAGTSGKKKRFNFNKLEKFRQKGGSATTPPNLLLTPPPVLPPSAIPPILEELSLGPVRMNSWVELKALVGVAANATENFGSVAAATATVLGELSLRGGSKRNPPITLFGGPVLCVGSGGSDDDGMAYFYSRKNNDERGGAAAYTSTGPALPYPDFVEWNDDGRLCAIVVESRVAIYRSVPPSFLLLGTVRIGSAMERTAVTSVKFVHGVLYCTTRTAVQCIFIGDLERDDSPCHMDSFLLTSKDVPILLARTSDRSRYVTWIPQTVPMALNHPKLLGYQSGSLLVSTVNGIRAISLDNPLLRIGSLIAAGEREGAQRWLDAVSISEHETLAAFLDRRGLVDLAVQLQGLSIETLVDYCLKYSLTDTLVEVIETEGLDRIRQIDMGRGVSTSLWGQEEHGHNMVICVGAYLLSQGKVEYVTLLVNECLRSGKEGEKGAFMLAGLLMAVDSSDAQKFMKEALTNGGKRVGQIGNFYRDHVL